MPLPAVFPSYLLMKLSTLIVLCYRVFCLLFSASKYSKGQAHEQIPACANLKCFRFPSNTGNLKPFKKHSWHFLFAFNIHENIETKPNPQTKTRTEQNGTNAANTRFQSRRKLSGPRNGYNRHQPKTHAFTLYELRCIHQVLHWKRDCKKLHFY